jgi:signal transduction histidine kinase
MIHQLGKWLVQLLRSLEVPAPEVANRLRRVQSVERNLVLPLRLFAIAIILYSLHRTPWFGLPLGSFEITVTTVNTLFAVYIALGVLGAAVLLLAEYLPFALVQWSVFAISLIDGIFVGALTLVSGGYDSPLFWLFIVLIVRNAASHPPVWSQLALNLCISLCFAAASFADLGLNQQISEELYGRPAPPSRRAPGSTNNAPAVTSTPRPAPEPITVESTFDDDDRAGATESIVIRLIVLGLASVWLYGVQVLLEKQRLAAEEAREFSTRENQLRSAGRLAAEFAHQIKNPLAIVNNAVYSLERSLQTGKGNPQRHLAIIQEEISRADRIITQVMGYAELTEGRVEKLELPAEIQRAVTQAFPDGLASEMIVKLDLHGPFPPMLMQRRHLSEVFLNLLLNAREATHGRGRVVVSARVRRDQAVEVTIRDDGPGIPADKIERIFEAYFTTKERGTGLGLAIVKNNVELYGGTVRVESELGKGACFTLVFPAKASLKLGS